MNFSTQKLCLQLFKCCDRQQNANIVNSYLLRSFSNSQTKLDTRAILTRPKELDAIRKKVKEREEDDKYKDEDPQSEMGLYSLFLLSMPVIAFGLGTWQIYRRQWKLEFIKDLESRLSKEPIEMPENLDDLAKLDYCPIKVRGEFLYDKEFTIGPRSLIVDGHGASEGKGNLISNSSLNKGYNIITPFKLENRDTVILVNRGWVPYKGKQEQERLKTRIEGTVEFTGINRLSEARPQFVPKNNPEKSMWLYRNVHEMAEYANTEPVFLDMIESFPKEGMPIGSQTRVNIRNEHLSYIVTWYGLAAFTGFYWFRIFIMKRPIF